MTRVPLKELLSIIKNELELSKSAPDI